MGKPRISSLEAWTRARLNLPEEAPSELLHNRLYARQAELLADTLLHAKTNAPYYANLLENAEELAQSLRAAALPRIGHSAPKALALTLERLPFTEAQALAASPERFLAVNHNEVEGIISLPTSGSSGPGKRIFCAQEDLAATVDFFVHGMRGVLSGKAEQRLALLMSGERPGSVGDLFAQAAHRLNLPCRVFGPPGAMDAAMDALLEFAPSCLVGLPGQLLALARHARAKHLAHSVDRVLFSGSAVSFALREAVAGGLGCDVFQHYGLTEAGLAGAVDCAAHAGCHSKELDWFLEIVSPEGRPLPVPGRDTVPEDFPPGAPSWSKAGELVLTTLTRRAMPLIRYRTGDAARLNALPCACGSPLLRLEILGRIADASLPELSRAKLEAALLPLPWTAGLRLYHCPAEGRFLILVVTAHDTPREDAAKRIRLALTPYAALARVPLAFALCSQEESLYLPGTMKQNLSLVSGEEYRSLCSRHSPLSIHV